MLGEFNAKTASFSEEGCEEIYGTISYKLEKALSGGPS